MKRLLLLFALASPAFTQVKLTWTQPANPGWGNCATVASQCLDHYVIFDASTGQTFTVPVGTLAFSALALPGVHNYALWVIGIDANGNLISSTPPAITTVTVTQ
jgi:hypothetical protein